MKKKIVSFAAVLMAMAMTTTSAFAVTPRESGDVDGSGTLTAGDAVQILNSANQGTEITNGDFDGSWKTTDQKVTAADAERLMDYVLQPEKKFDEVVGLRFYSVSGIGSAAGTIANPLKNLELNGAKNYDNTYASLDSELTTDSNKTIVEVADQMVSLALTKDGTASKLADNLNKVYFHSENKGDVYLTSKDGWAKLAYALKAINPVSPEDCERIGKPADDPGGGVRPDGSHHACGEAIRHRGILCLGKRVPYGQRGLDIGPAAVTGMQMLPHPGGFLRGKLSVDIGVQQGRKLLAVCHCQPSFSVPLDAGSGEKFPLFSKKFRSCFRARLIRDFTVPTSRERESAISS